VLPGFRRRGPCAELRFRSRNPAPEAGCARRGSQDSNLESPVLETGASGKCTALASQMQRRNVSRERQRERTVGEIPGGSDGKRRVFGPYFDGEFSAVGMRRTAGRRRQHVRHRGAAAALAARLDLLPAVLTPPGRAHPEEAVGETRHRAEHPCMIAGPSAGLRLHKRRSRAHFELLQVMNPGAPRTPWLRTPVLELGASFIDAALEGRV
jgi:hypothetical protein